MQTLLSRTARLAHAVSQRGADARERLLRSGLMRRSTVTEMQKGDGALHLLRYTR
jgi:hypothetical protein